MTKNPVGSTFRTHKTDSQTTRNLGTKETDMLPGNEEQRGGDDELTGGEVATENTEPATDHTDHADHGDETPEHDAAAVDETLKQGADMHAGAAAETGSFSDDVKPDITEELRMLKGLSDGTISREEGRAFIAEHYPELND